MENRFKTLDGWRGISILLVLAGHLLPLGPKTWQMNGAVAATGMVIFFILSGFLITTILIKDQNIIKFLIRRFMRIIPLAWLAIIVVLFSHSSTQEIYLPHLLFFANWEPIALGKGTGHLWSLCVEIQFYVLIAFLVAILKSRAFLILPVLALAITSYRYYHHVTMAINTYYRIDEILAGCMLALIGNYNDKIKDFIGKLNPIFILPLLIFSAHPKGYFLNYLRPYLAMLLIGSTLFKEQEFWLEKYFSNKQLVYIATVSYAVYIFHGSLMHTWLDSGTVIEKYTKLPLLISATFLLAHLSTFYYEKYFIKLGKRLTGS